MINDRMRLNVRKELHLTPWDLVRALVVAGLIEEDTCETSVQIIPKTEINQGRTVIISWANSEQKLGLPEKTDAPDSPPAIHPYDGVLR